jgi:hypothetical protein
MIDKNKFSEFDESKIPSGIYCHGHTIYKKVNDKIVNINLCPYWDIDNEREKQENGYCHFIGKGDWEIGEGDGLLWDKCKECGKNHDDNFTFCKNCDGTGYVVIRESFTENGISYESVRNTNEPCEKCERGFLLRCGAKLDP